MIKKYPKVPLKTDKVVGDKLARPVTTDGKANALGAKKTDTIKDTKPNQTKVVDKNPKSTSVSSNVKSSK